MAHITAKLFTNGGSQAVRLPAQFRFEEASEVYVRKDVATGDIILSSRPLKSTWSAFFQLRRALGSVEGLADERPLNTPLQPHNPL